MSWIQTYTDKKFCFVNPTPGMVDIKDVAHALSQICRYNGHARVHYSVAEHSVLISDWIFDQTADHKLALQGLLHDAHEAYIGDVTTPLKRLLGPVYREVENRVNGAVADHFGIPHELDPIVKEADMRILKNERQFLLGVSPEPWHPSIEYLEPLEGITVSGFKPSEAAFLFLLKYRMWSA